jgi:hypothetical protein
MTSEEDGAFNDQRFHRSSPISMRLFWSFHPPNITAQVAIIATSSFPVIGPLSSRPPFGRIEPAAESGSRATDGRPSSKRSPISL